VARFPASSPPKTSLVGCVEVEAAPVFTVGPEAGFWRDPILPGPEAAGAFVRLRPAPEVPESAVDRAAALYEAAGASVVVDRPNRRRLVVSKDAVPEERPHLRARQVVLAVAAGSQSARREDLLSLVGSICDEVGL
jgi:hypothetical protein